MSTVTKQITYDIETGAVLDHQWYEYGGPWELEKMGRESEAKVTDQSLTNAASDKVKQGEQYGKENTGLDQLTTVGANGLGLGASGYLNNALENISKSYGNARQNAARVTAGRGFAGTPDGAFASGLNSANIAQAGDENKAYNDAQMLTRENMLQGLGMRQGLQTTYDPNHALGTAGTSAEAQSRMGSTLGDIGRGLTTAASLASTGAMIHG